MTTPKPRPSRFPLWLKIFWAVVLVGIVILFFVEILNDPAMSNTVQQLLGLVAFSVSLCWFAFTSRWSKRIRLVGLLSVAGAVGLFFVFFRLASITGALLPTFEPRFGGTTWRGLEAPQGDSRVVDLETTSDYDFGGFLGPNRDLKVPGIKLDVDQLSTSPEQLWRQPIGAGLGGFAVVNGYAATLEQREDGEWATLYDVDNGNVAWATKIDSEVYASVVASDGPRSTPIIDDGRVYLMGNSGRLVALDGSTGKLVWERNFREEAGLSIEQERGLLGYGRPNSPFTHGDRVFAPVGGAEGSFVSLAALNKNTGETVWQSGSNQISGSSPNVATLNGVEQALIVNQGFVNGYDLTDGRELWAIPWPGRTNADTTSSQAVPIAPDRVFVSRGYGHGAGLYQLKPTQNGRFEAQPVWESSRVLRTKFSNVTVHEGHLYGLSEGVLECVDLETGKRVWKHGRYGHGQMLQVDTVLVVLSEEGEVFFIEATPDRKDNVLGHFQAIEGQTWNNFAIAGDRLVVRNGREAAVYRLPIS